MLFAISGCSTTNHAILPTQAYHDLTSHYNAYFNANEKLKGALQSVQTNHKDKFDSVIAVYYYSDPTEFASYNSDLEDVIKRSTQAIQLHNIANWSDDHMLLIGRASYYKGDYDKAASSFKYITTEFKEGVDYVKVMRGLGKKLGKYVRAKKKKKKPQVKVVTNPDGTKTLEKEDNRPKYSLWIHEAARSEALIWLVNTYTRQKKFDQASSVVTYVRGDDNFYKNLDPQLDLAEADLRVTSKNYAAAIEPLENYLTAKSIKKKKRLKGRPLFVLAQCYERTGNSSKAIENYKLVLKNRPTYDMEFYAKLKMAKLGRSSGGGNAAIRSLLAKMAKDGKYKEYWDQIYYELALISVQENNRAEARKFLRKSVDFSTTNDDQKALSYLLMAELDYDDEQYVASKFFYDTTLTYMAKNDPRYNTVDERNKMLDNLVTQLKIIAEEDSLQKLATLSENELQKAIRLAVAKKESEEADKKAKEDAEKQQQQLSNFSNANQPKGAIQQQQTQTTSSWYFYNTTVRANGYNDFIKKWGRRKLEEHWRRKNKSSTTQDEVDLANAQGADTTTTVKKEDAAPTGTLEEQMLAAVPTTPEKLAKSNERLTDAYYTAGTIYKDGLEAYAKAENMFETLNSRIPKHKLLLESYYNLYLIAQKENNTAKAEKYKNLILSEFPESVIAKILRNPNYINESKAKENAVNTYYEDAYNDYVSNNLDSAWYKCKMSDVVFKPNPLAPKFELLLALVLAKQNKLEEYIDALNKLVSRTTDVEVKNTASQLLSLLNKSSLPQVDLSKNTALRDSLNAPSMQPEGQPQAQQPSTGEQKATQPVVKTETAKDTSATTKQLSETKKSEATTAETQKDTAAPKQTITEPVVAQEDTTSPYTRTDNGVHYFIVYIKDPAVTPNSVMNTIAKLNAFNGSTEYASRKLQAKQIIINSTNKLINIKQFKDRTDVMAYYNFIKGQKQLFDDMQPAQYVLTCISTVNFATLLSEKDIDAYQKYFTRVYK
ncbi:MAG: hypothetical protein KIS94_10135 [Chitinophagales bacterium]|nr:hypothetical protein [Chitinophagales bacterium]